MTVASPTVERLQALEQLYAQGYRDSVVDLTLRKLLERQVQQDEAQLAYLRSELLRFEQQYGIASSDFYARYQAGQAGDDLDAFEWNVTYKMYARLTKAVEALSGQLRE
ncbi:MAG: hypothetical protein FJ011_04670 [Chloroflexi bacterium]|nr:hypothetical protein [Chloroflexota bacterium]